MSNMIPTVGRRVWYWPSPHERFVAGDQPFDAGVAHVHSPTVLTISVTSDLGNPIAGKQHVQQCEPEERTPGHWSWMPYQQAQAAQQPAQPSLAAQQRLAGNNLPKTPPDVGGA